MRSSQFEVPDRQQNARFRDEHWCMERLRRWLAKKISGAISPLPPFSAALVKVAQGLWRSARCKSWRQWKLRRT